MNRGKVATIIIKEKNGRKLQFDVSGYSYRFSRKKVPVFGVTELDHIIIGPGKLTISARLPAPK
jgi:hypothetical protein